MAKIIDLNELSKVIGTNSLSFETIKNDLLNYVSNLPDGESWKDLFYTTSDGNVILTILSGVSSFKAFHELSRVRESSLDYAELETNVNNLAANRGYLVPPAFAPEFNFYLKLNSSATEEFVIKEGDILGALGNYFFYSLSNYQISSYINSIPVKCVYGYQNIFNQNILTNKKNNVFNFSVRDKYIGSQLESFSIDGLKLELTSDSSIYEDLTKFLLRRVLPFSSKIYLGNGVIGFYDVDSKKLSYSCISYDTDIMDKIDGTPTLYADTLVLDKKELIINPAFEPDKEQIRNVARFYPIDGRIVMDIDYKVAILKYFQSYVYDCLSYNSDTDQEVFILIKNNYTPGIRTRILQMFDKRIALGIKVNLYEKQIIDGKTFSFSASIAIKNSYSTLYQDIITFLNTRTFKFLVVDQTITANDLCLELSAEFGIKFTPLSNETLNVLKDDFFSSININLTLV